MRQVLRRGVICSNFSIFVGCAVCSPPGADIVRAVVVSAQRRSTSSIAGTPKRAADGRNPVQVFLRVRPFSSSEAPESQSCIEHESSQSIRVRSSEDAECSSGRFSFSRVFDEPSSQDDVFGAAAMPLVTDLLLGKNALLFTYGVTNSGKTFTMEGPDDNPGVIKRLLAVVFNSIRDCRAPPGLFRINSSNGVDILVRAPMCFTALLTTSVDRCRGGAHRSSAAEQQPRGCRRGPV